MRRVERGRQTRVRQPDPGGDREEVDCASECDDVAALPAVTMKALGRQGLDQDEGEGGSEPEEERLKDGGAAERAIEVP